MSKKKIQALVAQVAVNNVFGQFRYMVIEGEIWFMAADVCKILGIKNVTQAVSNIDEDFKHMFNIGLAGRAPIFVNEPGLYNLIFQSRKPEAKKFQRWVYREVLPSIRKYGFYEFKKSEDVESDYEKAVEILKDLERRGIEWDCIFEGVTLEYNEKAKEFRPCYKLKITV